MKIVVFLLALISWGTVFSQQDRHYSMFFANPVQFNPAAAGHHPGNLQLFTNFRMQWFTVSQNPFRSVSASAEGKLLEKELNQSFIGAGVNFINDVSGDSKYTLNVISFPLNYSIKVNHNSYLSLGIQPGIYNQKMAGDQLYFDSQWDGAGFDTGISHNENIGGFSQINFDLGSGLYLMSRPSERTKIDLGISALHLTRQPINFFESSEKLYRNFTFYLKSELQTIKSNLAFHPAIYAFAQGPNFEITAGNNFVYNLEPPSKHTSYFNGTYLTFGLYYRSTDAVIANFIYTNGPFSVGLSYDTNISGLTPASKSVGAFEFYLKFTPTIGITSYGGTRIH